MKLSQSFYEQPDVVKVARDLLGKVLYTRIGTTITAGIISETEAYAGITDRASHAYGDRKTNRTSIMYQTGGVAYIYLCYGIHSLFNVVTGAKGIPHAVLVRSIVPLIGIDIMLRRRNVVSPVKTSLNGPGKVCQAMGLNYKMTGRSLHGNSIWIQDDGINVKKNKILITPRIGVDYAGEDALLPYRFVLDHP